MRHVIRFVIVISERRTVIPFIASLIFHFRSKISPDAMQVVSHMLKCLTCQIISMLNMCSWVQSIKIMGEPKYGDSCQ